MPDNRHECRIYLSTYGHILPPTLFNDYGTMVSSWLECLLEGWFDIDDGEYFRVARCNVTRITQAEI